MTATTLTKTARTLISAGTTFSEASPQRGTPLDLRTKHGGLLTIKITNPGSGITAQGVANVLVAHNAGATPSAGSAGTDWKTIWSFGGGTTASAVTEQSLDIPPGVMHLEVELRGATGTSPTGEAFLSEITDAQTA